MAPVPGPPFGGFFVCGAFVNIFVYSDESGVLDVAHNDIYVFGGLIVLSSEDKEEWSRRYSAAERRIRFKGDYHKGQEIKASVVSNQEKLELYKALNGCHRFGVVIDQKKINHRIFDSKKSKQRYLDYAYKIGVKRAFEQMIDEGIIRANDVEHVYFFVDEHTTATDGRYELREALEQEFKHGTFNGTWDKFFPPIFEQVKSVELEYCNSAVKILVRAADVVANRIFYLARTNSLEKHINNKLYITRLP